MMNFNKYPYTDFHELNLDWVINTVKELKFKVDTLLSDKVEEKIIEYFNKIMVKSIYHEDRKNITLSIDVVAGDGLHVYNAGTESMYIE